jgi:glucosamine--fructose-6-phosphate aminotransferase (isomerizing)
MTYPDSNATDITSAGVFTRAEIFSQTGSWQAAIDVVKAKHEALRAFFTQHRGKPKPVVFVGCGSPYYLNMTAAAMYRSLTGQWGLALPASEILFNIDSAIPGNATPLVVAVSRSGETSELLSACRLLKEKRGSPILLITVSDGTSLQKVADMTVYIPGASEQSVAQTRSFAAMLVATLGAVAVAAGSDAILNELLQIAGHGAAYLDRIQQPIAELINRSFDRMFFLGSGLRHGLAHEGSLKMKEMSISNSEPFHFMEFRHGPQSMIDDRTLVVGLVSQRAAEAEMKVLRELTGYGGTVIAIHPEGVTLQDANIVDITLPRGFSEIASLVFYMPALHLLAYHQAMCKGVNCDSPRNLHAWIKLPDLAPTTGA